MKKTSPPPKIVFPVIPLPEAQNTRARHWIITGAKEGFAGNNNISEVIGKMISPSAGFYFHKGYCAGAYARQYKDYFTIPLCEAIQLPLPLAIID